MAAGATETSGLVLRPLVADDCDVLASWISSEDALYQWSGPSDFAWPLHAEQLRRDLAGARGGTELLAATNGRRGTLLGHVKLQVVARHRLGLIGRVLIAPTHQGKGCGTALMRQVVAHGFGDRGLHRLQLTVYEFNTQAIACYAHAGFTVEGRLRDAALGSAGFWPALIMGRLESDAPPGAAAATKGWTVRAGRAGDRTEIARLLTELGYEQDEAQAGAQLARWSADPRSAVLVVETNATIGGFVALTRVPYFERPEAFARVLALSVGRAHRRQGLGRVLITAAERWARRNGCTEIELTSSRNRDAAHRFYPSIGYEDHCARSARYKRVLAARPEDGAR